MNTPTSKQQEFPQDERLLRVWDVAKLVGVSVPTVWRWTREGRLPQPIKLTPRVTVWKKTELIPSLEALLAS